MPKKTWSHWQNLTLPLHDVIKFVDEFDIPYEDEAERFLAGEDPDQWKLLEESPRI